MRLVFRPFDHPGGWLEATFPGMPLEMYCVPLPQLMLNLKDFINSKTTPKENPHGF